MRSRFGLMLALLLLAATPGFAQKIYIDYDRDADLSVYKSFAWYDSEDTQLAKTNEMMHSRIKNAIEAKISEGRLVQVESNPDLYVTYHTNSKEEVQVNSSSYGYSYGSSMYWNPYWGAGATTTSVYTYTRGTLIVDLWDAKSKKLVWRGSAEAVVPDKPSKQESLVYRAIDKMADKWQRMRAEDEKAKAKAAKSKKG